MFKKIIYSFIAIITIFLLLSPFALFQLGATVIQVEKVDAQTTHQAKTLIKQILNNLKSSEENRILQLNEKQMGSLLALISHTFPFISTRLNSSGSDWIISASVKPPLLAINSYINTSTHFHQGNISLDHTYTDVGRISISNSQLIKIIVNLLNITNPKINNIDADKLISKVNLNNNVLSIHIHPELNLERIKESVKNSTENTIKHITASHDLSRQVNHYLSLLNSMASYTTGLENIPISMYDFTQPLFREAKTRSTLSSAQSESRFALLALLYFSGDHAIQKVIKTALAPDIIDIPYQPEITLLGRRDLVLHFVYSATIELISNAEVSFNIGEIKELNDSMQGGSGYSFADIMADKAGIYFAQQLTKSEEKATWLQTKITNSTSERDFFPHINDLPEGLSEQQFKDRFGDRQSASYQLLLKEIDTRIEKLPIY